MRKPNFLIVGAPKCGTTSLYKHLQRHPEVYMPDWKEPYYFIRPKEVIGEGPGNLSWRNMLDSRAAYLNLFSDVTGNHKAIGKASAGYLYFCKESIPNIKKELGDPKIIIMIREPVSRSFSSHVHHVRAGRENCSFADAWRMQEERRNKGWWYGFQLKTPSLYSEGIEAFQSIFTHVKVILHDDLRADTESVVRSTLQFLEVNSDVELPCKKKFNQNLLPRSAVIAQMIEKIGHRGMSRKWIAILVRLNSYRPKVPHEFARKIAHEFSHDLNRTAGLIHRDLEHWKLTYQSSPCI